MTADVREKYVALVEYLGLVLGPSYEIALHDLELEEKGIIAIANGHITGRGLGAPITKTAEGFLKKKRFETRDHEVNYTSLTLDNKKLRSSTLYIKDDGQLVGLLCITFDDTGYRNVSKALMSLCHPDSMLDENTFERIDDLLIDEPLGSFASSVGDLMDHYIENISRDFDLGERHLKKKDRYNITKELHKRGFFKLKGSVERVCKLLDSSTATIYRYLKDIENE